MSEIYERDPVEPNFLDDFFMTIFLLIDLFVINMVYPFFVCKNFFKSKIRFYGFFNKVAILEMRVNCGGYKDICVDDGSGWLDIRIYASRARYS